MEGFIYIATNPLFPSYVKIGKTGNVSERMKKLGTGVPKPYKVLHSELVINASVVETRLHHKFSMQRGEGEWFKIKDIDSIKKEIKSIQNDIKKEFDIPFGKTIKEKVEKQFSKFGVGMDKFGMDIFIERLNKLNAKEIDNAIQDEIDSLLDYHPSIDECY
jgi:hypothetical protein